MMIWLYVTLLVFGTAVAALSVASVYRVTRRRSERHDPAAVLGPVAVFAPVAVLKPLCGADDGLEANLATFFQQDYPSFELVFGVEGDADPAIGVVERLRERFSSVPCRLVVHGGGRGINPKVSNLRAMLSAVTADVVVISDSNIAVGPRYLRESVAELERPGVGLVTHLFAGTRERCLGAALDNLHLNGPVAGGVAASHWMSRRPVVVGKSMAFRLSQFERLGGFESVATVLAEDYVMGRMFSEAGYLIRLAPQVLENVNTSTSVGSFWKRHLRWGLMRSRLQPLLYPLELMASPLGLALLAPLFGVGLAAPLLWALLVAMLRDAAQWCRLRGAPGLVAALPLSPLKELLVLAVWLVAPFQRHVSWRGRSVRLSSGTRLYATRP